MTAATAEATNRAAKALRLVDTITAAHPGMDPFRLVRLVSDADAAWWLAVVEAAEVNVPSGETINVVIDLLVRRAS